MPADISGPDKAAESLFQEQSEIASHSDTDQNCNDSDDCIILSDSACTSDNSSVSKLLKNTAANGDFRDSKRAKLTNSSGDTDITILGISSIEDEPESSKWTKSKSDSSVSLSGDTLSLISDKASIGVVVSKSKGQLTLTLAPTKFDEKAGNSDKMPTSGFLNTTVASPLSSDKIPASEVPKTTVTNNSLYCSEKMPSVDFLKTTVTSNPPSGDKMPASEFAKTKVDLPRLPVSYLNAIAVSPDKRERHTTTEKPLEYGFKKVNSNSFPLMPISSFISSDKPTKVLVVDKKPKIPTNGAFHSICDVFHVIRQARALEVHPYHCTHKGTMTFSTESVMHCVNESGQFSKVRVAHYLCNKRECGHRMSITAMQKSSVSLIPYTGKPVGESSSSTSSTPDNSKDKIARS